MVDVGRAVSVLQLGFDALVTMAVTERPSALPARVLARDELADLLSREVLGAWHRFAGG
jgi:hypothetical protein